MQVRRRPGEKWYMQHAPVKQAFSAPWLLRHMQRGLVQFQGSRLFFHCENGVYIYRIIREPGTYCCHCQQRCLEGSGLLHVEEQHSGLTSPDQEYPAGYVVCSAYVCRREE